MKQTEDRRFYMEELNRAVRFAQEEGLFHRLNDLYASIPEGGCGGCAACCMESVETHWVEFVHIYAYLQKCTGLLNRLIPRILRFYFLEGAEKRSCPFQLEGRRCAIYPVRPLPCRLFGQWGEEDYEANYQVTLRGNRAMAAFYQTEYALPLPEDVVTYKVPYCHTFCKSDDLTRDEFFDLLDDMMAIQSRFLLAGLAGERVSAMGLVAWLAGIWYDLDGLQAGKVAVMREYLAQGDTQRLDAYCTGLSAAMDGIG